MNKITTYCTLILISIVQASSKSCSEKSNGFYTDVADCRSYYKCQDGERQDGVCLEGSYFNEVEQICQTSLPEKCDNSNLSNNHFLSSMIFLGVVLAVLLIGGGGRLYYKWKYRINTVENA